MDKLDKAALKAAVEAYEASPCMDLEGPMEAAITAYLSALPKDGAIHEAACLTPAPGDVDVVKRVQRIHDACATPSMPRQSIGEMLWALLVDLQSAGYTIKENGK